MDYVKCVKSIIRGLQICSNTITLAFVTLVFRSFGIEIVSFQMIHSVSDSSVKLYLDHL